MYYFAYASNLDRKHMQFVCPDCKPKVTATLPNYKLIFVGWTRQWKGGTANIRAFHGQKVMGGVYDIPEKDLSRLDKEEGYPGTANRLNVTVFDEDGNAIQAFTYMRTGQLAEAAPSQEYVAIIQRGYREWGIT